MRSATTPTSFAGTRHFARWRTREVRSGETAVRAFSPQSETIAVDAFTTACEPPFLSRHRGMTTNDERPPARRMENGRLAYYKNAATSIFWDGIWDAVLKPDFFAPYLRGYLHF